MNTTTDVGSFKFIANALHTDIDSAVQYFIFVLMGVFDPLAVALVLALNKLIELRAEARQHEQRRSPDYESNINHEAQLEFTQPVHESIKKLVVSEPAKSESGVTGSDPHTATNIVSATDVVSGTPIADSLAVDDQLTSAARRRKAGGANNSVITN